MNQLTQIASVEIPELARVLASYRLKEIDEIQDDDDPFSIMVADHDPEAVRTEELIQAAILFRLLSVFGVPGVSRYIAIMFHDEAVSLDGVSPITTSPEFVAQIQELSVFMETYGGDYVERCLSPRNVNIVSRTVAGYLVKLRQPV